MVWYLHLFKNFPQFVVIHTITRFHVVNEANINVFLEFPCSFYDPAAVSNLISGFSLPFLNPLYIWKFSIHVLLKPNLKDFEHNLASMWNEHSFAVVWIFFVIVFLSDCNENWAFPILYPLYIFEISCLSVASFAIIFSHSEGCLFTLLIVSFTWTSELL